MILIRDASGQLGNKLHFLAYFIANQRAYKYPLIITCIPEYYEYFSPECDSETRPIILRNGVAKKLINKVLKVCQLVSKRLDIRLPGLYFHTIPNGLVDFDIANEGFLALNRSSILLPRGWQYRDYVNLQKYGSHVKGIFKLKPFITNQINDELELARALGDVVIGVHVRRTDYKEFNGGNWYFKDAVYLSMMRQAAALFNERRCVFVLCSDEVLEADVFEDCVVLVKDRSAIVDLYLLAGCDYILGPPSTFSSWASFYNSVPLCVIQTSDQKLKLESFVPFFSN